MGRARPLVAQRLNATTEAAINDLFWNWVSTECHLADADPALAWRPWGSENHDIQRVHTCWAGAELRGEHMPGPDLTYSDGSTVAAQRSAWTAYPQAFIRSRATSGAQVEFFSPTYANLP